jgi:hypothetical protein
MCLGVFLAAAEPVPQLAPWTDTPSLCLRPLSAREAGAREKFSYRHVYYVGSHTGCSCGFSAGDPANDRARASTTADLVALLRAAPGDAPFELWACWEGDEVEPVQARLRFPLGDLVTRTDWSEERTFSTVTRGAERRTS